MILQITKNYDFSSIFEFHLPQPFFLWRLPTRLRFVHLGGKKYVFVYLFSSCFVMQHFHVHFHVSLYPWVVDFLMAACAEIVSFVSVDTFCSQLIVATINLG